jgi:uncharacterized membrane-anchored protein
MKLKLLIVVLALQTVWLSGIALVHERHLANGSIIQLETEPIDPRDLLRGDYLVLNYKISNVRSDLFSPALKSELTPGTRVFVALAPGSNQFFEIKRASTNELTPAADEIVLRGQASDTWWHGSGAVHLTYGIERFYVAEGTGHPTGKLTVQAVVTPSGEAMIKEVFVNGKPYAGALKSAAHQ